MKNFYEMTLLLEVWGAIPPTSDDTKAIAQAKLRLQLPPEKPGYVRLLHRTNPHNVPRILQAGLQYKGQGEIGMTTTIGNKSMAAGIDPERDLYDNRYAAASVILLDVPQNEYRSHANMGMAPTIASPKCILGYYDAENDLQWVPNPQYNPQASSFPKGYNPQKARAGLEKRLSNRNAPRDPNEPGRILQMQSIKRSLPPQSPTVSPSDWVF